MYFNLEKSVDANDIFHASNPYRDRIQTRIMTTNKLKLPKACAKTSEHYRLPKSSQKK
jgi:hypothetical protein